ncbi:peptidyl-prolyl cis-trans isomerase [Aspergillus candidus]|uniref:NAD(P)H-hydrate epimerase n=1 Tax=Aspergillus candidus TaxID=41067 RepID=A0A2I2FBL5_ASPCN|nr:peptidyl-prolyl cis-trans isomerase [Aspergillus candidus]PLB38025.1 peptidyl-prolyl cis-trans isomerase [Aspergillus candidus]
MASEFIGYNVLVTLRVPPNASVQGQVSDVVGQRLMLRNVTLSWTGQRLPVYSIDAPDIADLSLGTQGTQPVQEGQVAAPASYAPTAPQSFVDPAILSFSKPPAQQAPPAPGPRGPPLPTTPLDNTAVPQPHLAQPADRDRPVLLSTLSQPFNSLELSAGDGTEGLRSAPQEEDENTPTTTHFSTKRGRRPGQNKPQGSLNEHDGASNLNPKTKGWRQTAFVEPVNSPLSYREKQASLNGRRGKRRNNRNAYAEDQNGWATEEATDIQEMGEFDFQSNLSKFDKRRVFEEIRNEDTTADEERLVSFNKLPKPGTNGGKNLHWTENVLDSPPESEAGDSERDPSDTRLSSGTYSGRDHSKASARPSTASRKGSGVVGSTLLPPQVAALGRGPLGASRNSSPRPGKTSATASPVAGPGVSAGTLRLITTNRSCPTVSPLQTLEVEQITIAELGLTEDMITENAGRGIAEAAVGLLANDAAAPTILVLTGNHRTGARAVTAARHLRNRGHRVTVCMLGLEHENELLESCQKQLEVFKKIGGRVSRWEDISTKMSNSDFGPDLIVDALFGIHLAFDDLRTDDQAAAFEMISWANRSSLDILSVDVPSGLSATSGEVTVVEGGRLYVHAKAVVGLGAPKTGIINALVAGESLGVLSVADIGIPQIVWRKYGTRRRHGIDFGNRWVVPLRYQASSITHSEWASEDAFSANAGAGLGKARRGEHGAFKRLPFNFCSLSLQPYAHPVCTQSGTIFDLTNIVPWIKKHGTNPVDGTPLKSADLIKLHLAKNEAGEYIDPVTYKVLTDNTHIVALRNTGNVFAWDTVERLNIKGKLWRDLVTDEEFGRKDIITLQDPQNIESRNLSAFHYLQAGESGLTEEQQQERASGSVNADALGSSAKILKAKEAVAKARAERAQRGSAGAVSQSSTEGGVRAGSRASNQAAAAGSRKPVPYNAARHTTGMAAASLTSTGLTPHTSGELALLSDEEYMLRRGRVKQKGYARLSTNLGDVNVELQTEYAPKAVWNFIKLAKKGYYRDVAFHRNIKGFMIQGGDPSGTGRGGESIWGKYFNDEFEGPLKHDSRGTLSMANKGKNTNSSQFFIAYRALPHLNLKHTIFGHVIDDPTPSSGTLDRMETNPVNPSTNRPTPDIRIHDVTIFVDPFEEFLKQRQAEARGETPNDRPADGSSQQDTNDNTDDDRVTWTGKRIRGAGGAEDASGGAGVGKYLRAALADRGPETEDEIVEVLEDEPEPEPARKKMKGRGGFGDFSSWD